MSRHRTDIPRTLNDITAEWLHGALRTAGHLKQARVVGIDVKTIGEGVGFLDGLARIRITYDREESGAPASVVVKVPAAADENRATGDSVHAYEREIRFYRDVAAQSPIRFARCYYTAMTPEEDRYVLVLEDLCRLKSADQVQGISPEQARAAVETIGQFHAHWWEAPTLKSLAWMPAKNRDLAALYRERWPDFVQGLGKNLPAKALDIGARAGESFEKVEEIVRARPHSIAHNDFRADNMLFDDAHSPQPVVVLDWQLATKSKAIFDIARLLCGSLPSALRSTQEQDLLQRWHKIVVGKGVKDYALDQAWKDYMASALYCLYIPVIFHHLLESSGERGKALAAVMTERYFTAIVNLEADQVLG